MMKNDGTILPPKDKPVKIDLKEAQDGLEVVFVGFWETGCVYPREQAPKVADIVGRGLENGGWTVEYLYR